MENNMMNNERNSVNNGNTPPTFNNYNMQQTFNNGNMPPVNNGNNGNNQGLSIQGLFNIVNEFTKNMDKVMQDIGNGLEKALNNNSLSNNTEKINETIEKVQEPNNITSKNMVDPVMGRSQIILSTGNELGSTSEIQEKITEDISILAEEHEANIGLVNNPEIHSIQDVTIKKDDTLGLHNNTDESDSIKVNIEKVTLNKVSLKKVEDA